MVKKKLTHNGKLDLACGDNKREGFFGIDKYKTSSTDAVVDLLTFPWPIASGSVDEIQCSHYFEHIPAKLRGKFMEEVHRVMKQGATATFITPLGDRALQDATHEWPPVVPGSFLYFNKQWRIDNKLQHGAYDLACDFDYSYGHALTPEVAVRNAEYQAFAVAHYNNAATDLHVKLTRK